MSLLTTYLDTCIVSGLAKDDLKPDEQSALLRILKAWKRGSSLSLVTSQVAKDEIEKIPQAYREKHETNYNLISKIPVAKTF